MSDKLVRIKNRYDTAANWSTENPVLAAGEIGIDSTNNIIKVGNGSSKWNRLSVSNPYVSIFGTKIYVNNLMPGAGDISIYPDEVANFNETCRTTINTVGFGSNLINRGSINTDNIICAIKIPGCLPVYHKPNGSPMSSYDSMHKIYSATDANNTQLNTLICVAFNNNTKNNSLIEDMTSLYIEMIPLKMDNDTPAWRKTKDSDLFGLPCEIEFLYNATDVDTYYNSITQ